MSRLPRALIHQAGCPKKVPVDEKSHRSHSWTVQKSTKKIIYKEGEHIEETDLFSHVFGKSYWAYSASF